MTKRKNPAAVTLGRLGGKVSSEKKTVAARLNAARRWARLRQMGYAKREPDGVSSEEMSRFGLTVFSRAPLTLQCDFCHFVWKPEADETGSFAKGFWLCPNDDCNPHLPLEGSDAQTTT
jgi:hypothetical protein